GRGRPGRQLERGADDGRQRAEGTSDQPPEVVAGDVLDDPSARGGEAPVAGRQAHADELIASRSIPVPKRAGTVGGNRTADRGGVRRRVNREPLAVPGKLAVEAG